MTEKTTKKKTSKKTKTTGTPPSAVAEEEKDDAKTPAKQQHFLPEEEEQQQQMMPSSAVKKLPQITVARLLNETQLGVAMHKRIVRQMTELRHVSGNEKFLQDVCTCLLHVLLEYKVYLLSLCGRLYYCLYIVASLSSFEKSDFENEMDF
tara:strand:- start:2636 stop:3085 length:450 start_codon:yes stop_codon:yes gene_type:complete